MAELGLRRLIRNQLECLFETLAAPKGIIPDAGNAITNRNARQAGATPEGPLPYAADAIRDCDARQAALLDRPSKAMAAKINSDVVTIFFIASFSFATRF
ncbi:MAG: hypothetical protein OSB44_12730, partial [Verrucomicrobiales bacterium]|nr:hypothetical protein [Verrucomicrobiales bacterium]